MEPIHVCIFLSLFQDKQTYPNKLRKLKKIVVKKDIIQIL